MTEQTYYRWRKEYGGLRLKQLEQENTRLRRAVADLTLDKQILQEAGRGAYPATSSCSGGDSAGRIPSCAVDSTFCAESSLHHSFT